MRKMKRVFCLLAALLLVLALPAGAVSSAGLTITPETTMEQLRSDPDVAGSGIWTYQQAIADPSTPAAGTTLGEYVGNMAQDCAAAMDYLTDCYRQGRQVTYKVYMAEEIAAEANRNEVELYYFPSHTEKTKYVVVMSGNVLNKTSNLSEGYATAWQLHELGYTVFVLRYRVFQKASNNAPLDDLGNAIRYTSPTTRRSSGCRRRITPCWAIPPAAIWQGCSAPRSTATGTTASPSRGPCCWGIRPSARR